MSVFSVLSFLQVPADESHCVSVFEDANCGHLSGVFLNQGGGSCQNVNTGGTVLSFKCFPGIRARLEFNAIVIVYGLTFMHLT
jgi:hypothetical protein